MLLPPGPSRPSLTGQGMGCGPGRKGAGYRPGRSGWATVSLPKHGRMKPKAWKTCRVPALVPSFLPAVVSPAKREEPCSLVGQGQEEGWGSVRPSGVPGPAVGSRSQRPSPSLESSPHGSFWLRLPSSLGEQALPVQGQGCRWGVRAKTQHALCREPRWGPALLPSPRPLPQRA